MLRFATQVDFCPFSYHYCVTQQEESMRRERALKVVLIVIGLLFTATVYPLVMFLWESKEASYGPMMLSLYVTLGVFLLLAARNPSAHRSLIGFTAWSSFAHGAVMTVQSFQDAAEHGHLLGGTIGLVIIGVALLALSFGKQPAVLASAAGS